jgi:type VI secretion system secreted protein Hcp
MATDYFLKLDGIDGESVDQHNAKSIEIQSFSWGASNPTNHLGTGSSAGKVSMSDLTIQTQLSAASPKIIAACSSGSVIKTGTLTCRKAGTEQLEYLKIALTDVFVSAYSLGGGGDVPSESVSLSFGQVVVTYKQQHEDGSLGGAIAAGWNVGKNVKV